MFCAPTEKNFDDLAGRAASAFMGGEGTLTDNVVKLAREHALNPEECRRLTEKANTAATVKMLNVSLDKRAEIELADIDSVLGRTHGAPSGPVKTAAVGEVTLPHTRRSRTLDVEFQAVEKTAAVERSESVLQKIFTTRQDLARMRQEKLAAELEANDNMDFLLSEFSKLYGPDFPKFASEAYTLYGEPATGALQAIGGYVREAVPLNKVASAIDDTTEVHRRFASFMGALSKIASVGESIKRADQELGRLWQSTGAY